MSAVGNLLRIGNRDEEKEDEKDPNVEYAPDGSVYNPETADTKTTDEDGQAEEGKKDYYDADANQDGSDSAEDHEARIACDAAGIA